MNLSLFCSSPNVSINGNDTDHDEAASSDQEKTDLGKFVLGSFQLLDLIIREAKSHITC